MALGGLVADGGQAQGDGHVPSPFLGTGDLAASGHYSLPWKVRDKTSELLLTGQLDEVHRVPGHPDRELRVLLRMLHRVLEGLAVEHVDVHVEAGRHDVGIQHADQVRGLLVGRVAQARRDDGRGERDAVLRLVVGELGNANALASMPCVSRPFIGLAPGANGWPARRPSGVLPVFLP